MVENPEKFILDATAGFRMMWFNKHHPNCLYIDQRPECEPDMVGDFRDLKQFPDETFRLIIFDPPHIIQENAYGGSEVLKEYGSLKPESWQSDLKLGFAELWRVLKPNGILLFKWANTHIPSSEVLRLAPAEPLLYQVTKSEVTKNMRMKLDKTLWFCFMKTPSINTYRKTDNRRVISK